MKKIFKKSLLCALCIIALLGCEKEETLEDLNLGAPVRLEIKGLILVDTLQFVLEGKVIGEGIDGTISISERLYQSGQKIDVVKKADQKVIGQFTVAPEPYQQVKKIFYDGTTFTDKIELTPVSNPDHMGFRLRFSTTFSDFYGGPVDVEFFVRSVTTTRPRVTTYTSLKLVKNITASFGDFFELPSLTPESGVTKSYQFKIYKSGTTDLPYTNNEKVKVVDPQLNYGNFSDVFTSGSSTLISISPSIQDFIYIGAGYQIQDLANAFQ